ncbi:hypothetical protein M9H77_36311 [Catharanthus roseus]|uniref:Uncharacterized protein n=1 Tax=Catharanthus roseus TaxID=4058 RepID=A0ACB9ZU17_CATRO|nr:hypothetical protein M9H77_36311 [Catharanthus roseus]
MVFSHSQAEDIPLNPPQFSLMVPFWHISKLYWNLRLLLILLPLPSFPSTFTFWNGTTHRLHFIHADDYIRRKRDLENEVKELHSSKKSKLLDVRQRPPAHDQLGPLPKSNVLQKVESLGILVKPAKMLSPPEKRNKAKFCQFYKDHGHNTKQSTLKYNQFHARISTANLSMEIPMGTEVYVIYGYQKVVQECYFTTVKEIEKAEDSIEHNLILKLELEGEYELFILDNVQPDHTRHIRHNLLIDLRINLAELLVEYKDIFAWSSSDLGIIPWHIVEHNNNEVGYEALLAGLRIEKSLKLTHILKYLLCVQHMILAFSNVKFEKVPREQNTRADMLSKLNAGEHIDDTWQESFAQEKNQHGFPIRDFNLNETLPDDPTHYICPICFFGNRLLRNIAFNEDQNVKIMHEHFVLINELREMATKRDAH